MAENRQAGVNACNPGSIKEAVCINTNRIYDSCKDKDCFEDLRVYLTRCGQSVIDRAINVKAKSAEIIWVYIDVEEVPFNDGFFTVDIKFFFRVTFDAFLGVGKPTEVEGLCSADKKVILFGSEGNAKVFSSLVRPNAQDIQFPTKTNMPKAVVECVDPIALGAKVVDPCERCCCNEVEIAALPTFICNNFEDELVESCDKNKLLCTLGLFCIVRLEREVQLLIPAYDFCIPDKECLGSSDDPCALFSKIKFPTNEFFPPAKECKDNGSCGCQR